MKFHHHSRHPWAQPGDEPDRLFILRFSDRNMREQVFMGEDAEAQAHAAYRLYCVSWNVYLLATVAAADIGNGPVTLGPGEPLIELGPPER